MTDRNTVIVAGNEAQLKDLIMNLLQNYGASGSGSGSGGSYQRIPSYVKGKCHLKVTFKGKIANTQDDHRTEKSFLLMKPEHAPEILDLEKLKTLAQLVHTKFDNLEFTTGQKAYTYNSPEQGFNRVWGYFASEADAMRLFEQLLDIQSFSPEWERLTESRVVQPGSRFQDPPEKVTQAGIRIRSERERPTALMKFDYAYVKFPHFRDEIPIANQYGVVITNLNVLQKMSD